MNDKQPSSPSLWQVITSVLASFFGVQSGKSHARDFEHGKPVIYIVVALVLTLVFVLVVAAVVKLVLSTATG